MTGLKDELAEDYLALLGLPVRRGEVGEAELRALRRAHLERCPYETVDIVRGSPPGIDPLDSVSRLVAGRGGYCYHLNGAFSELVRWLGADVTRHRAGVQGRALTEPQGADGNHLALTVGCGGLDWLVDVGLGDGPAQPLPLTVGEHTVDGQTYRLSASVTDPGGWRFDHDPAGSFVGFDIAPGVAQMGSFAAMHHRLSTDSGFSRVVTVQRRVGAGVEILRGCLLTVPATGGAEQELAGEDEWWSLVIEHFGLRYDNISLGERSALWARVRATHEAWEGAGRP